MHINKYAFVSLYMYIRSALMNLGRITLYLIFMTLSQDLYADSNNSVQYHDEHGRLPDGTGYLMRIPKNWNGIVIRDLDYASMIMEAGAVDNYDVRGETERYHVLTENGYAVIGTARHKLRRWQYDPLNEIENLETLLNIFKDKYGIPDKTIQFGCSGGGLVSLSIAEDFLDGIDGAVLFGAHIPVWLMNTFLDGWFVLKTLISKYYVDAGYGPKSDLQFVNLPNALDKSPSGLDASIIEAWKNAIEAAYKTPDRRARVVQAFALGQWSPWFAQREPLNIDDHPEQPDLNNPNQILASIYRSLSTVTHNPGGTARIMFENAAMGQQLSWNNDVDYSEFYRNANPIVKKVAEHLYDQANLDLQSDLNLINDEPRITASDYALSYWSRSGRTVKGTPKIPVIRLQMIGDYAVPYSLVKGYSDLVSQNGLNNMYRDAYVRSTGHCNFSAAESLAAVETLVNRIKDGKWPSTKPGDLNQFADSLKTGTPARFMSIDDWAIPKYNRTWVPK